MNWRDTVIRDFIRVWGIGMRWLGEDLQALGVRVPLCSVCLKELLHDADAAACSVLQTRESGATTYAGALRSQLAARSHFIYAWTTSDDVISADAASQALVKIARKYALPRPWKVSEPSVVEYDRIAPATWAREARGNRERPRSFVDKEGCNRVGNGIRVAPASSNAVRHAALKTALSAAHLLERLQ